VNGESLLLGGLSGALVVLSGALYALLFTLGKLRRSKPLLQTAFLSYAVLFLSSLVLARVLLFSGWWIAIVIVMLIGYWLAPQAIWHLCIGTHGEPAGQESLITRGAG